MLMSNERADVTKVVFDLPTAEEVVELLEDRPGMADEAVLDDALDALASSAPRVLSEDQKRAAAGDAVAIEMTPDAAEAVERLIRTDQATRPNALRRLSQRLRGKLERARRRSASHGRA